MKVLTDLFREWMPHQRWFGGKGREWADVTEDGFFLDRANPVLTVHRVRVTYTDGVRETYLVPLSWRDHPAEEIPGDSDTRTGDDVPPSTGGPR